MVVGKDGIKLKSFIEDHLTNVKDIQTEVSISSSDFDEYHYNATDTLELTFCLKEFKAILSFCEVAGQQIAFFFDKAGRPILFSVRLFNQLEADFVVATLAEDSLDSQSSMSSSSSSSNPTSSTPNSSNISLPVVHSKSSSQSVQRSPPPPRSFVNDEDDTDDAPIAAPTKKARVSPQPLTASNSNSKTAQKSRPLWSKDFSESDGE
eukprot:TRINITY_DN4637_c0_g1_i3.p1 TRINITY_DN4637_c0_g1~~TRINITY_DN4637_c0_g1_i3.p1  ORF type:complete len:207 (-),score=54.45 TRINITY_DN4637_c0_g1_i3:110-730(-)